MRSYTHNRLGAAQVHSATPQTRFSGHCTCIDSLLIFADIFPTSPGISRKSLPVASRGFGWHLNTSLSVGPSLITHQTRDLNAQLFKCGETMLIF